MKKILLSLVGILCSLSSVWAADVTVAWPATAQDVSGTTPVELNGFYFVGNNPVATLTSNGFYTGGNSTATARHIYFTPTVNGILKVEGFASGDNTNRFIAIATSAKTPVEDRSDVLAYKMIPEKGVRQTLSYSLTAGTTYYILIYGNGTISNIKFLDGSIGTIKSVSGTTTTWNFKAMTRAMAGSVGTGWTEDTSKKYFKNSSVSKSEYYSTAWSDGIEIGFNQSASADRLRLYYDEAKGVYLGGAAPSLKITIPEGANSLDIYSDNEFATNTSGVNFVRYNGFSRAIGLQAGDVIEVHKSDKTPCVTKVITRFLSTPTSATLNANGFATFSSPTEVSVTGAEAYTASVDEEEATITWTKIEGGIIPANEGVLLKGEAGATATFTASATSAGNIAGNDLKPNLVATTKAELGDHIYVLYNGDIMLLAADGTLAANRAYFQLSKDVTSASGAKAFSMVWNDGTTTGINNIAAPASSKTNAVKVIKNGKLVIETANGTYNVAGSLVK